MIFAIFKSVMLISWKVTQDKREVTDIRIVKNNVAYPLVRDTHSVCRNFKCKVLWVLGIKDAFHSLWLMKDSKRYCGKLP